MVDWFPFHGSFRLSGGATLYNNTGLTASLNVPGGQSFSLGDTTYISETGDPIHGTGVFTFGGNKVAPRVTLGFGNMVPAKGHFRFISELGFEYINAPTVAYNISGSGCQGPGQTNCGPVTQTSVQQEQQDLQNDLNGLRFFPIFSLGISYKIH